MGPLVGIAAQALVATVVTSVASIALSKLTAKSADALDPKRDKARAPTDTKVNVDPLSVLAAEGGPLIGIFGRRRVGGRVVFDAYDSQDRRHLVIVMANATIAAVDGLYINNVPVSIDASGFVTSSPWNSAIRVTFYRGNQTAADPLLKSAFPGWTSKHVGRQTAYARITLFDVDPSPFSQGVPDFTFAVRGHFCYDPRKAGHNVNNPATWSYSENAAIIGANYMISAIGADVRPADVNWTSVAAAAAICDENIDLRFGDATEDRYTCALTWQTDEDHEQVLDRIGAAMGGGVFPIGGKWCVSAAKYEAATGDVWTPDCYTDGGLTFPDTVSAAERPNGVRGTFCSPAHNYEKRDFPAHQDASALALDGGREHWLDLDLTTVTSHTQAQRLARIAYFKARHGIRITVESKFENYDTVANDVIALTDGLAGFSALEFRVIEERADGYDLTFEMQRELSSFYDWTAATDEKLFIAEKPVDGSSGGDTGSGWTAVYDRAPVLTGGAVLYGINGGSTSTFRVSFWEAAISGYRHEVSYEYGNPDLNGYIQAKLSAGYGSGDVTFENNPIAPALRFYQSVRHRVVNTSTNEATPWRYLTPKPAPLGVRVAGTTIDNYSATTSPYFVLPAAKYPAPSNGTGGGVRLTVPHVDSPQAATIEILHSDDNDPAGATVFGSATNTSAGATFNYPRYASQTRYVWARAANGAKKGPVSNVVALTFT